ncbi:UDP-galactopyranose mutase [Paraburkholderia sp. 1N]|uniref:UDP-galactopyranose mutase n=1 Tax=Paraburkholderia solitsugae TaxID=2675748 RepID=A0ABX2BJR0_9BURK|nr:UDP-galactopyranose mutase [Paraburkholderia solitsugae]NPT40353.1 UDP-galactopyranose mutase [Paraburkholderia solitsugae]
MQYDYLVVGAGFAGSVCAERLSSAGNTVLLIDKRDHIGGNAYDCVDSNGILIHPYGPHIFHTNSQRIFEYLSKFTDWRFYEHRVLAELEGRRYPIPINKTTINTLYNLNLQDDEVEDFYKSRRIAVSEIRTSEDIVLNSVGHDLCEKFFRGYTRKQWGLDLSELSAGVAARIPTRTNDDDRYFTDSFQFMPSEGYSIMFEKMLAHKNIEIRLSTSYEYAKESESYRHTIFTGPIDLFFEYKFGPLPYRSLRFEHEHFPTTEFFQETGTVNFPNDFNYTRITEFKYLTGQQAEGTSIVREFPQSDGDPYYPIPRPDNEATFKKYQELAEQSRNVTFVGRLANYRYYNMDQVVANALSACEKLSGQKG